MVRIIDHCNPFILVCHFVENGLIRIVLWSRGRMLDWSARLMPKAAKKQKANCLLPWLGAKISNWEVGPPHGVVTLYIWRRGLQKLKRSLKKPLYLSRGCPITANTQKPWEGLSSTDLHILKAWTEQELNGNSSSRGMCSSSCIWVVLS